MARPFDKQALREALLTHYPWLLRDDLGPRAVEAGECDRCGDEPRMVAPCGPSPHRGLGRRCAADMGVDAWCPGHTDDARSALAWLARLPEEADDVARLWWVATGEVRVETLLAGSPEGIAEVVAGVLD